MDKTRHKISIRKLDTTEVLPTLNKHNSHSSVAIIFRYTSSQCPVSVLGFERKTQLSGFRLQMPINYSWLCTPQVASNSMLRSDHMVNNNKNKSIFHAPVIGKTATHLRGIKQGADGLLGTLSIQRAILDAEIKAPSAVWDVKSSHF